MPVLCPRVHSARLKSRPPKQAHINVRDQEDYKTPSTRIFQSFIQDEVVRRYAPAIECGEVASLRYVTPLSLPPRSSRLPTPPSSAASCSSLGCCSDGASSSSSTEIDDGDDGDDEPFFEIVLTSGLVHRARAVVLSIGPGGIPRVPDFLSVASTSPPDRHSTPSSFSPRTVVSGPGWCHTSALLADDFVFPTGRTMLVIGGG